MKPFWLSRKFWYCVFGVLQSVILYYFDVPKEIWLAIDALVGVLIASVAYEDAAEKRL
jgi:hypothetical protein